MFNFIFIPNCVGASAFQTTQGELYMYKRIIKPVFGSRWCMK